jgi:hypothetical protein
MAIIYLDADDTLWVALTAIEAALRRYESPARSWLALSTSACDITCGGFDLPTDRPLPLTLIPSPFSS